MITAPTPIAERCVDLAEMFPGACGVFRMVEDAAAFNIARGDLIVFRAGDDPGPDGLAVVRIHGDDTPHVRVVHEGRLTVTLKSGSPAHPDVVMKPERVYVAGRVVGVVRQYGEAR